MKGAQNDKIGRYDVKRWTMMSFKSELFIETEDCPRNWCKSRMLRIVNGCRQLGEECIWGLLQLGESFAFLQTVSDTKPCVVTTLLLMSGTELGWLVVWGEHCKTVPGQRKRQFSFNMTFLWYFAVSCTYLTLWQVINRLRRFCQRFVSTEECGDWEGQKKTMLFGSNLTVGQFQLHKSDLPS